jgi:hypothetical protein
MMGRRSQGQGQLFYEFHREPDRQAAATAQAGVVRGPVRDPMALLRNMVAVSEALERQRLSWMSWASAGS